MLLDKCARASESPIPLVKLDTVVPDIVPDIISWFEIVPPLDAVANNFKVTVPELGKFVDDASVKLVDDVVISAFNVVDIFDDHSGRTRWGEMIHMSMAYLLSQNENPHITADKIRQYVAFFGIDLDWDELGLWSPGFDIAF